MTGNRPFLVSRPDQDIPMFRQPNSCIAKHKKQKAEKLAFFLMICYAVSATQNFIQRDSRRVCIFITFGKNADSSISYLS